MATLITLHEPRSPISEAFRALRTSVRMANAVKPIRRLLITSAGPSEGKTFVASNLAISLAQEGKRVILVDADLRRPQVHKAFGLSNEPGLTNWAVDEKVQMHEVIRSTIVPNLAILTCGIIPPNPAELLGSERMTELIKALDEQADIVIYDSPPAATVTDAVILATQMDGVLQVVRAGLTRIDLIQRCKTLLDRVEVHILGPVLNGVQASDLGYYANYYYYGSYYQPQDQKATPRRGWFGKRKKHRSSTNNGHQQRSHSHGANGGQSATASPWTLVDEEPALEKTAADSRSRNPFQRRTSTNGNHDIEPTEA
jgi:capsular exopolysaccharide synthesis family protein